MKTSRRLFPWPLWAERELSLESSRAGIYRLRRIGLSTIAPTKSDTREDQIASTL